jgi:hypothetical protein
LLLIQSPPTRRAFAVLIYLDLFSFQEALFIGLF